MKNKFLFNWLDKKECVIESVNDYVTYWKMICDYKGYELIIKGYGNENNNGFYIVDFNGLLWSQTKTPQTLKNSLNKIFKNW